MKDENKKTLLKVARDTVEAVLSGSKVAEVKSSEAELNEECGCFVTLKRGEQLRGCIGRFISDMPLIELVSKMAKASATSDPRFFGNPLTKDELDYLNIEISVLSPLQKTDDPLSLRLGVDGIYIQRGAASGCFLPQVATETGWSKEEFLSYCCAHKAGLEPDAWKSGDTEVYFFQAEIFDADFVEI